MTQDRTHRRDSCRFRAALGFVLGASALAVAPSLAAADPTGAEVRISSQGPPGNTDFAAVAVDLAYNPAADQYLAVWEGDTATTGEREIFGRLLDGGANPLGGVFRVSTMGPDGDADHDGGDPAVAFNGTANEYLVVWRGDDALDEDEIVGQRISAVGSEVGADDFRISDLGPDGDPAFDGAAPDVTFNSLTSEYLVVFYGDDDAGDLVEDEQEIYGQRLDASGAALGANDFRISDVGADGDAQRDGRFPKVAYNPADNQFLVVWEADEASDNEREIYGQRIGPGGGELGANDFQISTMGQDGNSGVGGEDPAVAHNDSTNEYLVVWLGDEDIAPLVDGEEEVFGQRLGGAAADERGSDDFRISDMGPDGDAQFDASDPEVAANPRAGEFRVTWQGDDGTPPLVAGEFEIFTQRLTGAGGETGTNDAQVSRAGPDGDAAYRAVRPSPVAYNSRRNEYLIGWEADGNAPPQVADESEIFVRRASAGPATGPPPPICAAAPTPPTPSPAGTVTLTLRQLRINQRIYSAAIKRADAITAWLDDGVATRDLCAGGLSAAAFGPGVNTGPGGNGPLDPSAAPDPRPITPDSLRRDPSAEFTLSTTQLRINQRIAARAVREANALQERLAAKLSGGDVDDGAVTVGKISTALTITGATPTTTPPARTTTDVKPATRKTGVTFTLTAGQLGINQRIGQAAIRRLNTSRDALGSGVEADDLKTGTITAVDLAPGVAP